MVTTIRKITIEGESYLSLYSVAECFACEPSWVEDVFAHGLLGHGHRHEGEVVILSRLLDRVAMLWLMATTPSYGDWQWIRLPDWLSPLYYLVRPIRLALRAIRRR
jgi:hypothetical protein